MRVHLGDRRAGMGLAWRRPALRTAHSACALELPPSWLNTPLGSPLINELNKSLDMSAFCICMTIKLLPFPKLSFSYCMAEQVIIETFQEQLERNIIVNFITI